MKERNQQKIHSFDISWTMFSKWIRCILKYYTFCGFYYESSSIYEKCVNIFIFSVHVIWCIWCTVLLTKYSAGQKLQLKFLDLLNSSLYAVSGILLYWFIIYDTIKNQRYLHNFWQIYAKIIEHINFQEDFQKWKYLSIFFSFIFVGILFIVCAIIVSNDANHLVLHYSIIHVVDNRVLFYLLHLFVIASLLQIIETKLKKCRFQRKINKNQLKWIRNSYKLIYELSNHVNKTFGLSHLLLILVSFLSLLTHLNVTCSFLQGKLDKFDPSE